MRWHPSLSLLAILLTFFSVRELSSQTTNSGALSGVVTDSTQAVIAGVQVEIRDLAKGSTHFTSTDAEGVFRFFFLTPGTYLLSVNHPGFREENRTLDISLGPPLSLNLTLKVAGTAATVEVSDHAPIIQTENGDVSATMNQRQVSELTNPGNDLTYIVQTAPGVVMNTDVQGGANFSILGMPGFSYLHTMDGMNDNDSDLNLSLVGPLVLLLGQNEIQEATVVSTGYSGHFGGAAGGNINYVTKSGSNQFHGNAQYYWNGSVLNANDWFSNAFKQPRVFSIANQWAGSVGGPIREDSLFFFFDTEGLRLIIPQHFLVTIPSPQFEDATLNNIRASFGLGSASDTFYQKMFQLYNAAPGVSCIGPDHGTLSRLQAESRASR